MADSSSDIRTYSGHENNKVHNDWGAAGTRLLRRVPPAYDDGKGDSLARSSGPNPRVISNIVCKETFPRLSSAGLSDFVWAWGQFLDHEIDLTPEDNHPPVEIPIPVPVGDSRLPTGGVIPFKRSVFDDSSGTREQINQISSYIDASNVYGSNDNRAGQLRSHDGTGKLKVSEDGKNLLPKNIDGFPNAGGDDRKDLFLAGDVRVNEHSVLTSMHTLFMREHNRRCERIIACVPGLNDEDIYQRARRYVGALEQVITYEEFIPALLGKNSLTRYGGYQPHVNSGVENIFSTASYRLGHSMLSEFIRVEDERGSLALRDLFFKPFLIEHNGVEPFLGGLAKQRMREIDAETVESVRSFLFHEENSPLIDLAALNIQRGRDHGLPDYNACRNHIKLPVKRSFGEITSNVNLAAKLEVAYLGDINAIDPWLGGLAEDPVSGSNVGELIFTILKDQFERFRDGDRFWYECDDKLTEELSEIGETLEDLKGRRLSQVIRENTTCVDIPDDVFHV